MILEFLNLVGQVTLSLFYMLLAAVGLFIGATCLFFLSDGVRLIGAWLSVNF